MKSSKLFLYIAITILVAFLCKMFYANILAPNMEGMHGGGNNSRSGGRNPGHQGGGRPPYTYRNNTNVIYTGGGGYGGYYNFPIYGYYYDPMYVYPNSSYPVVVRNNDVQDQYTLFLFMIFFFAILAIMLIA